MIDKRSDKVYPRRLTCTTTYTHTYPKKKNTTPKHRHGTPKRKIHPLGIAMASIVHQTIVSLLKSQTHLYGSHPRLMSQRVRAVILYKAPLSIIATNCRAQKKMWPSSESPKKSGTPRHRHGMAKRRTQPLGIAMASIIHRSLDHRTQT